MKDDIASFFRRIEKKIITSYRHDTQENQLIHHTITNIRIIMQEMETIYHQLLYEYSIYAYNQGINHTEELIQIIQKPRKPRKKQHSNPQQQHLQQIIEQYFRPYNTSHKKNSYTKHPYTKNSKIQYIQQTPHQIREQLQTYTFKATTKTQQRVNNNIENIIRQGTNKGESTQKIEEKIHKKFTQLQGYEAERIARTEVNTIQNNARYNRILTDDLIDYQQWVSATDNRTRDTHRHQNLLITRKGGTFPNGCKHPGDKDAPTKEWINCRCTLIPYIPEFNKIPPSDREYWHEEDMIEIPVLEQDITYLEIQEQNKIEETLSGFDFNSTTYNTNSNNPVQLIKTLKTPQIKGNNPEYLGRSIENLKNKHKDLTQKYTELYNKSNDIEEKIINLNKRDMPSWNEFKKAQREINDWKKVTNKEYLDEDFKKTVNKYYEIDKFYAGKLPEEEANLIRELILEDPSSHNKAWRNKLEQLQKAKNIVERQLNKEFNKVKTQLEQESTSITQQLNKIKTKQANVTSKITIRENVKEHPELYQQYVELDRDYRRIGLNANDYIIQKIDNKLYAQIKNKQTIKDKIYENTKTTLNVRKRMERTTEGVEYLKYSDLYTIGPSRSINQYNRAITNADKRKVIENCLKYIEENKYYKGQMMTEGSFEERVNHAINVFEEFNSLVRKNKASLNRNQIFMHNQKSLFSSDSPLLHKIKEYLPLHRDPHKGVKIGDIQEALEKMVQDKVIPSSKLDEIPDELLIGEWKANTSVALTEMARFGDIRFEVAVSKEKKVLQLNELSVCKNEEETLIDLDSKYILKGFRGEEHGDLSILIELL